MERQVGPIIWNKEKTMQKAESQRLDWWREARFGMFIHWGLYALAGGR